jgi:hypothetical protein
MHGRRDDDPFLSVLNFFSLYSTFPSTWTQQSYYWLSDYFTIPIFRISEKIDRIQMMVAQFTNHKEDCDWETLAQRRTIKRFKAYSGDRAWKTIRDRFRRPYYLSRVDHVWKIRDRKQRTDIGKYSFLNKTIKNWNQLTAEAFRTLPCKPKIF